MSMCHCDFDSATLFSRIERKARKQHRCYECQEVIKTGDLYSVHKGMWVGDFDEFKICERCQDLADSMQALGFCFSYGELLETHAEYIREYQPPRLSQ